MKKTVILFLLIATMFFKMLGCAGSAPAPQSYNWEIREFFVLGFNTRTANECTMIEYFPNMPDEKGGFLLHVASYKDLVEFRKKSREEVLDLLKKTKESDRRGSGESRRLRVCGR